MRERALGDRAAVARDADLQLQDGALGLQRLRAVVQRCELRVCDGQTVIERVEPQYRRAGTSHDLRVVCAQRGDMMRRRIRAADARSCQYRCRKGDKRQEPPPRRVCLPKHEGRTVPQLQRRNARSAVENGTFAQVVIDACPQTLLRSCVVTHRPLPVRPSRPRSGGRHS